jgi:hypothetical protein
MYTTKPIMTKVAKNVCVLVVGGGAAFGAVSDLFQPGTHST